MIPNEPSKSQNLSPFQLYKTATSISMKASCFSREFSLKLSLAYSEMDENSL